MKNLKYMVLLVLAASALTACKDDPELLTTDKGPEMTVVSSDASGVFGGKLNFSVTMKDKYPLSTLKAQIYFDSEMVAEEVIRTKTDGTYTGTILVPFYKDIPDGAATLKLVGQNIRFGLTTIEKTVTLTRPKPAYLSFMLNGTEYKMLPTSTTYEYAVTANFPQKPQGYITTPALNANGDVVTFGYDTSAGSIMAGSTELIPFANSNAGNFTVKFNIKTFEGAPFIKLLFNDVEMTMVDLNNYTTVTTLTQGSIYTLTGISDFTDWDVDRDFFSRANDSEPQKLTFLPMSGMYKITANFKYKYLKVEAMSSATALGKLNADGTGTAIWAIGGTSVGKPSLKNAFSWDPEKGGLCLAKISANKYQLTLVAGLSIAAATFDFKFFYEKTWGGEFKGEASSLSNGILTTTSDLVEVKTSGNLGLKTGKKLEMGGVYRFTIDLSGGTQAAVLTVEKIGTQILPAADIMINSSKLTQVDADNYYVDLNLTQGQSLTMAGSDKFVPAWINPDFFAVTSASSLALVPLGGYYRILINVTNKVIDGLALNASGTGLATLNDAGHGAIYFIGYGIGSPAAVNEPGWTTEKGVCVPEYASGIYKMTAQAGKESSETLGQRFRINGWDGKFFAERGWGGLGTFTLKSGSEAYLKIASNGNINMADNASLTEGTTYELTIDMTAGKNSPVVSIVAK